MERELVKVPEAAQRLGIGKSKAYQMAKAGELPGVVRIGSMTRVSLKALDQFIESQTKASAA